MTPHRWHRIQTLFGAVADLPQVEREAALKASGEAALRGEVEVLLEAETAARQFFDALGEALPGARGTPPAASPPPALPP